MWHGGRSVAGRNVLFGNIRGTTDSEVLFHLALVGGKDGVEELPFRLQRVGWSQAAASAASTARGESTSASAIAAQPAIPAPAPSALCSMASSRVAGTTARR